MLQNSTKVGNDFVDIVKDNVEEKFEINLKKKCKIFVNKKFYLRF